MSSIHYTEPRRKRTTEILQQPLPIPLASSSLEGPSSLLRETFVGELCKDGVRAQDPNQCLFRFGSFGSMAKTCGPNSKMREVAQQAEHFLHVEKEIPDFSSCTKVHENAFTEASRAHQQDVFLQNYEAFFLCYAIGCLRVKDAEGNWMTIESLWDYFNRQCEAFTPKYCVYHHFRAKGWVVKCGLKYGAHFLLYKWGPQFYHASYSILVAHEDSISWRELSKLNRISESVAKELMLAIVVGGEAFDLSKSLESIKIQEVLVKRWIPSQVREV